MRQTSAAVDKGDKKSTFSGASSFHFGLKRSRGERTLSPLHIIHLKMSVSRLRDWLFFTMTGCILYSIGLISPVLTMPVTFLYSFPTAFLAYEYGLLYGLSSALFSAVSMGLVVSGAFGLMYFVMFGIAGTMIGVSAKMGASGSGLLVVASTQEFLGKLVGVLLFYIFYGVNLFAPQPAEIEKSIMALGASLDRETARAVVDRVILLIPYAVIIFSVLEAFFCLILLSYIHRRRTGGSVYSPPAFREWRFQRVCCSRSRWVLYAATFRRAAKVCICSGK